MLPAFFFRFFSADLETYISQVELVAAIAVYTLTLTLTLTQAWRTWSQVAPATMTIPISPHSYVSDLWSKGRPGLRRADL